MSGAKKAPVVALEALIAAHAVELKLPTVRRRFKAVTEEATREQQSAGAYRGARWRPRSPSLRSGASGGDWWKRAFR